MAPATRIQSFNWNYDASKMAVWTAYAPAQSNAIYVSNHSYGLLGGWEYFADTGLTGHKGWHWTGLWGGTKSYDDWFGTYHPTARDWDDVAYTKNYYLAFAAAGNDRHEVVIGVSPAFGIKLFQTIAGHPLSAILRELIGGITEGGARARVVRMKHTADTSFLGLSAARLAGSGVGIGIQAKGTAVIHQKDRLPHNNLELFSNSPITRLEHYRRMGANAAAYALVAYQTAYLKAHYPVEYMAALLNSFLSNTDQVVKLINECREKNLELLPPDVNASDKDFTVVEGKIRFGLGAVKNVGEAAIEGIIRSREEQGPFQSFYDFVERVDTKKVTRRVLEQLVKCGAFAALHPRRAQVLPNAALETVQVGEFRLDPDRRLLCTPDGQVVKLTNLETRLLYLLMNHPAWTLETDYLVDRVWGHFGEGDSILLKNLVYRLRRKIEPNPSQPCYLLTEGSLGYRFRPEGERSVPANGASGSSGAPSAGSRLQPALPVDSSGGEFAQDWDSAKSAKNGHARNTGQLHRFYPLRRD